MRLPTVSFLNHAAFSRAALVAVCGLGLLGCPDKKPVEPPKPPPLPVKVEAPKPPPAQAEQIALKECAAPLDPAPAVDVKIGERAAKHAGYKLSFADKDADGQLVFGVLGPVNEDSGENMLALKKYVKFFQDEKADAIIVTGDVGEKAPSVTRVLEALAAAKLPVLVVIGNRECRAEFTDGVNAAKKTSTAIVNLNEVRAVEFPELTVVSLPGYHDANFINCATGCQYYKSTVNDVVRAAKDSKVPVLLVSHGPPHGSGNQALDFASAGGNVGDEGVAGAIKDGNIAFGVFSNIKEAGGRATGDAAGATLVKEGTASKNLYFAAGPADTIGWEMNDGTKSVGMAAVISVKDGQATHKLFRAKPLTAAEKAEAKKLNPPPSEEPKENPAPPVPPAPAPKK